MSGQSLHRAAAEPASVLLARHALSVRLSTLTAEAVAAVRAFTFDTLAVGVAGAGSVYASAVRDFAKAHGSGREAQLWGFGDWTSRREAAFCNAFLAHCQEFDCVHEAAVLHPFTVVLPVLCAEAQALTISGADFIAAAAAGVDIAAGLGVAATSPIKFFRPATYGLFGAVAALSRVRGLSEAQTAHAFGYALAFASGTMQAHSEGTPALAVQVGNAARCAFDAVDLAVAGLPGPLGSIDGQHGVLRLFETSHDLDRLVGSLTPGARASMVSWKPYPTGRAAHGGLDMVRTLHREGLRATDIEGISIEATPLIHHLVGRPIHAPLEVNYARLCLPYLAAVMARRGGLDLSDFSPEALRDPLTHALAARIVVTVNDASDPAAFLPQRITVALRDGSQLQKSITALPGSKERPLSEDDQREKALSCLAFGFAAARARTDSAGAMDALWRCTRDLEALDTVAALSTCVSP